MNCVSYTRATNCLPEKENSIISVKEQNDHISRYISSRKWKLVKKYSDRKHDPEAETAFVELREDGVNRRFDCVVVDSMYQCGRDAFQAASLFKKTFYPAGIHFAVVEDDFCSADVSSEEVETYLNNIRGKYSGRYTAERIGKHTVLRHLTMYGFIYDRKTNTLQIDEPSAAVVREIIERTVEGERPLSIAKDLTRRGIETPSQFTERLHDEHDRIITPKWERSMVHSIAKNQKYCGRWERVVDGKDLAAEAGCIVDPELFDRAQEQIESRCYTKPENRRNKGPSPVAGRMWDKESGLVLVKYVNSIKNITDIRFRYPKEKNIRYDRISMDYKEFMERVTNELRREKQECLNVYDAIHSHEGKALIDQRLKEAREPVPEILKRMGEVEARKMSCYREFLQGDISELTYKRKKAAYILQLKKLDSELEEVLAQIETIYQLYSDKNPWIALYRYMDENKSLTRKRAMRYIEKVLVYRFESVEMIPYHKNYKDVFPKEWLRGGRDGKDE